MPMATNGVTIVGPAVDGNPVLAHLPNCEAPYGIEGIHWVHGQVTEDDEAGRALIAAWALNKEEPQPVTPLLFDFVRKTYDKFYHAVTVP